MQKHLAFVGPVGYSVPVHHHHHMTPTILPRIKPQFEAIALETAGKATEKYETKYFANVEFTRDYGYGQVKTYAVGDEVTGIPTAHGLAQYCNYGAVVENVIPWNQITTKTFCTVREYKTTVFEIVEK